jgi:hypothetical protein
VDNDCDGQVDEGGDALCDDDDVCNGGETQRASGCQAGTPLAAATATPAPPIPATRSSAASIPR